MAQFLDRVRETSTSTGTGDFTLDGAYPGAYQRFSGFSTADFYYCIVHTTENEWEVGIGTYELSGSDHILHRDTVLDGSSGVSLVDFSTGTKDVFNTIPASVMQCILDAAACGPGGGGGGIDDVGCEDVTGSGCTDFLLADSATTTTNWAPQQGGNAWTGTINDVLDETTSSIYASVAFGYGSGSPNNASPRALRLTWSTGSGGALENLPSGKAIQGIEFKVKHWITGGAPVRVHITDGRDATDYHIPELQTGSSPNIPISTLHCEYDYGSSFDFSYFTPATNYISGTGTWTTDDILAAGGVTAQLYAYLRGGAVTTDINVQYIKMKLCWAP